MAATRSRTSWRVVPVTAAVAVALPLAGCSSSGSSSTSAASGSGTKVVAIETEFHITLSRKTYSPGVYTFTAENKGSTTHALSISGPGVDNAATADIDPGQSASVTVTLQKGSYDIFCPVGDHKMLGMDTHITVS